MPRRAAQRVRRVHVLLSILSLCCSLPAVAFAAWPQGSHSAVSIASADSYTPPVSVPDGAGGFFVLWQDPGGVLMTQRYDSEGDPQWAAPGAATTTCPGFAIDASVSPDGTGGLLVAWMLNGDISHVRAQRISAQGERLWGACGLEPAPSTYDQRGARIVGCGDGGALMIWLDTPITGPETLRAQRFAADGDMQWGAHGLNLCSTGGLLGVSAVVSDSAGGAHVVWPTYDHYEATDVDLVYQHVDSAGALLTPAGSVFCDAPGVQEQLVGAPAPGGDAVFAWADGRDLDYSRLDIRVQRVSREGVERWTPGGLPACAHTWNQRDPALTVTPDGVAWCAWVDDRFGAEVYDVPAVFLQAVAPDGAFQLPPFGLRVTDLPGASPSLTRAPDGEAIVEWLPRSGGIRVQKLNTNAKTAWGDTGIALACGEVRVQTAGTLVSGLRVAMVWVAQLAGGDEARAQVLGADGAVGSPSLAGVEPSPPAPLPAPRLRIAGSPAHGPVRIESPEPRARIFDSSGRHVAQVDLRPRGAGWRGEWDLRGPNGHRVPAGVYFVASGRGREAAARIVVLSE